MDDKKQYITQLNRQDLAEIRRACNPVAGTGILIDKQDGQTVISISEDQFKRMVYSLCRQAWNLAQVNVDNIDLGAEVS